MLDHMVNNCLFSCHGNMSQLLLQLVVAVHQMAKKNFSAKKLLADPFLTHQGFVHGTV